MRLLPILAIILLSLSACTNRLGPAPQDYGVLRTYGWESTVPAPQAEWNPTSYVVLARSAAGFATLDEGGGRQAYYGSKEGRTMSHAAWLSANQFVFGPETNALRATDGSIVPSTDGLEVVTVHAVKQPEAKTLARAGWRPRPWGKQIVCQIGDSIQLVDSQGRMSEFGPGFNAEPQPGGPGICWMEKPILEPDYWTAREGLGQMVIRWRPGVIDTIPAAVEACWTADGGLVATVLRAAPPAQGPWWSAGSDLVYLSGPGAKPVVVAAEAHGPACHPQQQMLAASTNDGRVILVDLSPASRPKSVIAEAGERPRWSADGQRLLVEEPLVAGTAKDAVLFLRVYVLSTTVVKR